MIKTCKHITMKTCKYINIKIYKSSQFRVMFKQ